MSKGDRPSQKITTDLPSKISPIDDSARPGYSVPH